MIDPLINWLMDCCDAVVLDAPGKLGRIIVGMNKALGDIPVTAKFRTGVKEGKNTVHKLMPRVAAEWGASCLTVGFFSMYRGHDLWLIS